MPLVQAPRTERGEREAQQPADPQISWKRPPSLHPQGPVHPEARRGARESRLCPGCWAGRPSCPRPARLACSTQRAGFQLGGGSPDLGGWKEVLPPLTLLCGCLYLCRGTPPRPPRPLLELLMPSWLPGTLGVSSYSSHKRARAKGPKCSLRFLGPSQHHWWGWAVPSGSQEGLGRCPGPPSGSPRALPHPLLSVGPGSPVQGAPLSSQPLGYGKPPRVLWPPALHHSQAQLGLGAPGGGHHCEPCPPCSASWGTDPACAGGLGSQPRPGLSSGTQASESQLPPGVFSHTWASYLRPQEPPTLVQSWPESQPQRWDCHSP